MNKFDMTLRKINHDKPLREYYNTHETDEMIACIHLYNEKKLGDYNPQDIRKMIMQNLFLEEMIPMALEILKNNEMINVKYYTGDLLSAVVKVNKSYWKDHVYEKNKVDSILKKLNERIDMFNKLFYQ